ncbi:MAG: 16S rRNA processing protein RimM [Candidatus Delongbacteria bacterium]|nr:16S rRNA processing protein RimM [Candidatus Delongbacteria bacterium]
MLNPDDYIFIGIIGKTTKIDGSLTIVPLTTFPERFKKMEEFFLTKEYSSPMTVKVTNIVYNNKKITVKLDGINSIEKAQELMGYRITVHIDDKTDLPEDYYYHDDLKECKVYSDEGEELGQLIKVLEMSSNDIYVVNYKGKELLIPAISQFVKEIDIEKRKITVSLINGMLPDEN